LKLLSTFRRRLLATGLFLCAGIAGVLFLTTRRADDIEWLAKSPIQQRRPLFSGPRMQPVRIQLLRMKQWMFGPRQTIAIDAMIFELSPATVSNLASHANAFTNDAGARAFMIESADRFRNEVMAMTRGGQTNKLLSSPRMITADGMQAQMASYETVSIGTSTNIQKGNAGWWVDVWPRASGYSTDLACFLTQTERVFERVSASNMEVTNVGFIRTNISLGARVRIPESGSLFLLSPTAKTNGYALGVLISSTVQKKPGR
jgi:hypothetical protein